MFKSLYINFLYAAIDSAISTDCPTYHQWKKKNKNCYLVLDTQQVNPTFGLVTSNRYISDILNIRGVKRDT